MVDDGADTNGGDGSKIMIFVVITHRVVTVANEHGTEARVIDGADSSVEPDVPVTDGSVVPIGADGPGVQFGIVEDDTTGGKVDPAVDGSVDDIICGTNVTSGSVTGELWFNVDCG